MSSPVFVNEFVSAITTDTMTLTPRVGLGGDASAIVTSITVVSINPMPDFFQAGRNYRVRIERV